MLSVVVYVKMQCVGCSTFYHINYCLFIVLVSLFTIPAKLKVLIIFYIVMLAAMLFVLVLHA